MEGRDSCRPSLPPPSQPVLPDPDPHICRTLNAKFISALVCLSKKVDPALRRATVPRMLPCFPWSQTSFDDLLRASAGEERTESSRRAPRNMLTISGKKGTA